jgi:hypothetical protein
MCDLAIVENQQQLIKFFPCFRDNELKLLRRSIKTFTFALSSLLPAASWPINVSHTVLKHVEKEMTFENHY